MATPRTPEAHAPTPIDEAVFGHLADLAALELSPDEAEYLRRELNLQLRAIAELAAADLPEDTPITSHGIPYEGSTGPGLRSDEIRDSSDADAILEQAPEREGRYIVVPDLPPRALE